MAACSGQRLTSLSVPRFTQSWVSATFYAQHYYISPWVVHTLHRWITWVLNFITPFDVPDKDHLYSLSAGAPVSREVERDVFRVEMIGKEAKEEFVREHSINGSSGRLFFEPIKQQRLKTMESTNKAVRQTGQYLYSHLYFTALVLLMDSSTR